MLTRMVVKGSNVDVKSISCAQLGSNHFELSGVLKGIYNSEDIDNSQVWIDDKQAKQVAFSHFQQKVHVGEEICSMFVAQVLLP